VAAFEDDKAKHVNLVILPNLVTNYRQEPHRLNLDGDSKEENLFENILLGKYIRYAYTLSLSNKRH